VKSLRYSLSFRTVRASRAPLASPPG
jgi:hypothetical protein